MVIAKPDAELCERGLRRARRFCWPNLLSPSETCRPAAERQFFLEHFEEALPVPGWRLPVSRFEIPDKVALISDADFAHYLLHA